MEYTNLSNTDTKVSKICLGTMTWGRQNTAEEAFEQIEYSLDAGINFMDAAEMYPVPVDERFIGDTETIIGQWFAKTGRRNEWVLASKMAGPGRYDEKMGGPRTFHRQNIFSALEGSLKRLQTDCIDLYQLHWPDRKTNFFGVHDFKFPEPGEENFADAEETVQAIGDLIQQGKIRHWGLSNENPWGTLRLLRAAEKLNVPKPVSVQNAYNLLNRIYEVAMSEVSFRENIGLLPYSPLAFGVLSGKYANGAKPPKARLTLFPDFQRYSSPQAVESTDKYLKIAKDFNVDPSIMSVAFTVQRPFVTSSIIGATTMEQLRINIKGGDYSISQEMYDAIEKVHLDRPNPCV